MRICVPTESDSGLDAPVSAHFGRAPYFAFVESASKQVEFVENRETGQDRGRCLGAALAVQGRPDAVAASGMGQGAFDLLRSSGARVYLSKEPRLEEVVDALIAEKSPEMTTSEAMGHHHAGHSAQSHHDGGTGHGGGCCGGGHSGHGGGHR